eukprot:514782-Pleurochrysis_carterae.AAC.1
MQESKLTNRASFTSSKKNRDSMQKLLAGYTKVTISSNMQKLSAGCQILSAGCQIDQQQHDQLAAKVTSSSMQTLSAGCQSD